MIDEIMPEVKIAIEEHARQVMQSQFSPQVLPGDGVSNYVQAGHRLQPSIMILPTTNFVGMGNRTIGTNPNA